MTQPPSPSDGPDEVSLSMRLPSSLVERIDELVPELSEDSTLVAVAGGKLGRSSVLRLAMLRGVEALERQFGLRQEDVSPPAFSPEIEAPDPPPRSTPATVYELPQGPGAALKAWREAQDLTQIEAARMIGTRQRFWSELERGLRTPDRTTAEAIEDATGIPQSTWDPRAAARWFSTGGRSTGNE